MYRTVYLCCLLGLYFVLCSGRPVLFLFLFKRPVLPVLISSSSPLRSSDSKHFAHTTLFLSTLAFCFVFPPASSFSHGWRGRQQHLWASWQGHSEINLSHCCPLMWLPPYHPPAPTPPHPTLIPASSSYVPLPHLLSLVSSIKVL